MNPPFDIIRDTLRQWRRHPASFTLAGISLALGIAGTTALAALIDAVYFRTLAVQSPHTLIRITATRPGLTSAIVAFPPAFWEDLRASGMMEQVAAAGSDQLMLSVDGDARLADVLFVSGTFLELLGVGPILGHTLGEQDDRPGAAPRGLISHAFWQTAFAGQPDVIGRTLFVHRTAVEIAGVLPASFLGIEVGRRADIVLPLAAEPIIKGADSRITTPRTWWLQLFGRLRPGQTREAAGEALRTWFHAANPPALRTSSLDASGLRLEAVPGAVGASGLRDRFGHALWVLLAGAFLVVCLASVNAASIFLTRFTDREREFSIRQALGAGRAQLIIRGLLEALCLTVTAAAAGVTLAPALARMAVPWFTLAGPRGTPPYVPIEVNGKIVAAGAALALLSGAIAGVLPAMRAVQRATGMSGTLVSGRLPVRHRALLGLVGGQVAVSLLLLSLSSLLLRSFLELSAQPTAVDRDKVLLVSLEGMSWGQIQPRLADLTEHLLRAPGVEAVSASTYTPLSGLIQLVKVNVPGFAPTDVRDVHASVNHVSPSFFEVFGTPLVAGRPFDDRDHAGAPPVAIVNQAFARRYLGGGNPVGERVTLDGRDVEIIGQVADGKYMNLRETTMRFVYLPLAQARSPAGPIRLAVRAHSPADVKGSVLRALREYDPQLLVQMRTLDEEIGASMARERLLARAATLTGAAALLISIMGLYGSFSYLTARRRAEIGIRLALGASRASIARLVLATASIVMALGSAAGLAAAFATGRLLETYLFGIGSRDPGAIGAATTVLAVAALAATALPAWRASRVDPIVTLRAE